MRSRYSHERYSSRSLGFHPAWLHRNAAARGRRLLRPLLSRLLPSLRLRFRTRVRRDHALLALPVLAIRDPRSRARRDRRPIGRDHPFARETLSRRRILKDHRRGRTGSDDVASRSRGEGGREGGREVDGWERADAVARLSSCCEHWMLIREGFNVEAGRSTSLPILPAPRRTFSLLLLLLSLSLSLSLSVFFSRSCPIPAAGCACAPDRFPRFPQEHRTRRPASACASARLGLRVSLAGSPEELWNGALFLQSREALKSRAGKVSRESYGPEEGASGSSITSREISRRPGFNRNNIVILDSENEEIKGRA